MNISNKSIFNLKLSLFIHKMVKVILYVSLLAYTVITLVPFLWTISSSLKEYSEIVGSTFSFIPKHFTFDNYKYLFTAEPLFLKWIFNSLFIGVCVTALNILLNSMAGYVLARIDFRGKKAIFAIIIATLAVPGQILLIPNFIIMTKLHLINTYSVMIIPSAVNAGYIFMMRQFFINFPKDIEEAARMDGLGGIAIFFRIVFPLMKSAVATQGVFIFMGSWNDFMKPLLYLNSPNKFTLPLGLSYFQNQYYTYWNYVMAAAVVSIVPILILYILLNKYFIVSLALGEEK